VSDDRERERQTAEQIQARGLTDVRVLTAMLRVPRHSFVEPGSQESAHAYMVALMTAALDVSPGMRILEVGTGSGYQAAILAELGAVVTTIECSRPTAARARAVLALHGYGERVRVVDGDGSVGLPADGPYDGILVTAATAEIPRLLLGQLLVGGRLVMPLGEPELQVQVRLRRTADGALLHESLADCHFAPLLDGARCREV
jgi:protein-L-isoaspartate(D-aspartate) O-methyltransferase